MPFFPLRPPLNREQELQILQRRSLIVLAVDVVFISFLQSISRSEESSHGVVFVRLHLLLPERRPPRLCLLSIDAVVTEPHSSTETLSVSLASSRFPLFARRPVGRAAP